MTMSATNNNNVQIETCSGNDEQFWVSIDCNCDDGKCNCEVPFRKWGTSNYSDETYDCFSCGGDAGYYRDDISCPWSDDELDEDELDDFVLDDDELDVEDEVTREDLASVNLIYDDSEPYDDLGAALGSHFHDGHERCAHLLQGAFLGRHESTSRFWRPVATDEDIGYTDDESDEEEEDNNTELESASQPSDDEIDVKLCIEEHDFEPEEFVINQERFERSLYEDFRECQEECLWQDRKALANQRAGVTFWRMDVEEAARVHAEARESWTKAKAVRKEWFDAAMLHRFSESECLRRAAVTESGL